MKILGTTSHKIFSGLIRDITGETASHVVIQCGNFIIHSNFRGLNIEWAPRFMDHNQVVWALCPVNDDSEEQDKMDKLLRKRQFSPYDFGAMIFLGLSLIARKYLKIPLPKSNLWQSTGMVICVEWVEEVASPSVDSMLTPDKLKGKLLVSGRWTEKIVK